MSVYDTFRDKSLEERANIVQQTSGCALCLDWTGDHKAKDCQAKGKFGKTYEACSKKVSGSPCGKRHNSLLHGTGNKYCNSVKKVSNCNNRAPNLLGKGAPGAPTVKEIEAVDGVHALFQLQYVSVESKSVKQASTFYDPGSNVNLVRKRFAKEAGWKGQLVLQSLYMTGGQVKEWRTEAYHVPLVDRNGKVHKVMAYSIEIITAPMEDADLKPALKVFPEVKDLYKILRPEGDVDLLLGIQDADLHPYLAKPNKHCIGNLCLLTSRFGSGYLLDGSHPEIKVVANYLSPEAKEKSRGTFIRKKGSKPP